MDLVKTVKCKLQVTPNSREALNETLSQYAQCCNDTLDEALEHDISNPVTLHKRCYHPAKERYDLVANYVVRALRRVCGAVKTSNQRGRKPRRFKPTSLDLDSHLFRLIEKRNGEFEVSLSTVHGRKKIPLAIGNYQRHLLTGQKPTSATLNYNRRKREFYINIVLKQSAPAPNPTGEKGKVIGVDLGIVNLATTSHGMKFSGKEAMHVRRIFASRRASVQSKGTTSARRVLQRLSGRESRWMANRNHLISRRIIDSLEQGDTVVMERLTHIRERMKVHKRQRMIQHSWAFGELQRFIDYKAREKGINVEYVDPAYTSQDCSRCGHRAGRIAHRFSCSECGHRAHADHNAAHNLRWAYSFAPADGRSSTRPEVTPEVAKANLGNCATA